MDHFIGLEEEGWRDGQAEGLRGLEVDDQLERHRSLHRQVGRLGTLQDLVDEGGGAPDVRREVSWCGRPVSVPLGFHIESL